MGQKEYRQPAIQAFTGPRSERGSLRRYRTAAVTVKGAECRNITGGQNRTNAALNGHSRKAKQRLARLQDLLLIAFMPVHDRDASRTARVARRTENSRGCGS